MPGRGCIIIHRPATTTTALHTDLHPTPLCTDLHSTPLYTVPRPGFARCPYPKLSESDCTPLCVAPQSPLLRLEPSPISTVLSYAVSRRNNRCEPRLFVVGSASTRLHPIQPTPCGNTRVTRLWRHPKRNVVKLRQHDTVPHESVGSSMGAVQRVYRLPRIHTDTFDFLFLCVCGCI